MTKISSKPSLEPYVAKLERFELFSTNQCYYLVGCNKQNTTYRVLKMDRTMIERPTSGGKMSPLQKRMNNQNSFDESRHSRLATNADNPSGQMDDNSHTAKPTLRPLSDFLIEDSNLYTQEEIKDMLEMIHDGNRLMRPDGKPEIQNRSGGGLNPIVKAYGIVGFIRFLDCYYLTLITRRAKVGSIGDNAIYTIKNTETVPIKPSERRQGVDDAADPSSVLLSMWNRGKRSVGLGLTNREIAELRYQGLYQVVDLTKNFYFSYTYDMTRSLQENFLAAITKPIPPPPLKDMFSWNYFLTREFEACLTATTSYHWIMPIIHGAFDQRKVNDYGRYLNVALLARRSRHFAGTRYLKRGVSEQGKVANDVEYEQILHDESLSEPGMFSSFLQVRGSIPTFWTQESSVTMPKPPIELNRVDPTYTATQLHFADLFRRYSSPVVVLDLVKQSEKREREVRVGNEFRHAIDYINHSIDRQHKIRYCALDYSHISKHRNLDVSYALNEVATWAVNQTGFFCSAPKWKIKEGGVVAPFTESDGNEAEQLSHQLNAPVFPMEQRGILRTNCIDCLDRTNVAQFSTGVEAMGQQLVVMGIRSQGKLGPSSSFVRVLIDLYVDIGDSIALQYGGSEAHKKVTASVSESISGPIGKHKELLTSIRRYYSNAFTDRLKQDAMNLFLGYYLPFRHSVPLWEMENDYYLHNFHVLNARNATMLMKSQESAFGGNWGDDDEMIEKDSPVKLTTRLLRKNSTSPPQTRFTEENDGERINCLQIESKRVATVRRRCLKQNLVLSSWWKLALQANLQDRMWVSFGSRHEKSLLPHRFDRVYQPEKLGQFDRVFSRSWEIPVRRSHSAQHTEETDGDERNGFFRTVSVDFLIPKSNSKPSNFRTLGGSTISLKEYVNSYDINSNSDESLQIFAKHFEAQEQPCAEYHSLSSIVSDEASTTPSEYQRYCEPMSRSFLPPEPRRIEEFNLELNDCSLHSDDVSGIDELARSSHLGDIICRGEYRGLSKDISAIAVSTALHEQFLNVDAHEPELQYVEREMDRKGFNKEGIKESFAAGCREFSTANHQYNEILKCNAANWMRSGLTSPNSLQKYVSNFDDGTELWTADRIFLHAYEEVYLRKERQAAISDNSTESMSFVNKAARLGIKITPHQEKAANVLPPVYQSDQTNLVLPEFEQINEDMFSRKENKFMVFNGAGVESWTGTQSLSKCSNHQIYGGHTSNIA